MGELGLPSFSEVKVVFDPATGDAVSVVCYHPDGSEYSFDGTGISNSKMRSWEAALAQEMEKKVQDMLGISPSIAETPKSNKKQFKKMRVE